MPSSDYDRGSPQTVSFSRTGAPATATHSLSLHDALPIYVGTTSAAQPVTLTNSGGAALSISSIAVTGTNSGDFAQTNNCGTSLAASSSCTINGRVKP